MSATKVNAEQQLYVIPEGKGYSCLGFDVCEERIDRYAAALGVERPKTVRGTVEAYDAYQALVETARLRNQADPSYKLRADLVPQLIGLEGSRVEIVDRYGEKRRFWVGISTGWIPIHLEVHNTRSTGGGGVTGAPFQSLRVVRAHR